MRKVSKVNASQVRNGMSGSRMSAWSTGQPRRAVAALDDFRHWLIQHP
jgi:hypothetical protein